MPMSKALPLSRQLPYTASTLHPHLRRCHTAACDLLEPSEEVYKAGGVDQRPGVALQLSVVTLALWLAPGGRRQA